jgi:hypothetical protein
MEKLKLKPKVNAKGAKPVSKGERTNEIFAYPWNSIIDHLLGKNIKTIDRGEEIKKKERTRKDPRII